MHYCGRLTEKMGSTYASTDSAGKMKVRKQEQGVYGDTYSENGYNERTLRL